MTNQLSTQAFNDALANKKLIFGVLKKCHITRQQSDFDDYFQECLLAYVDAYCQYEREQYHRSAGKIICTPNYTNA